MFSLIMRKIWGARFFLLFMIIFIFGNTKTCLGADNTSSGCIEYERQALLQFKQSLLSDPSNRLESWNGENCCQWLGVSCDIATRHVIRLDLQSNNYNTSQRLEGNELNSSLAELTHLNHLDLNGNYFGGSPVPEFIGSMKQLRFLNLSSAGFSGLIPRHLGNLSNLSILDLSGNSGLVLDDVTWFSRLSSLQYLNLSSVDLSKAQNFDKVLLYMIPSLLELRLSSCGLSNANFSHAHHLLISNTSTLSSTIQTLDLSSNSLEGKFPVFLQNMTSLRVLDLSNNRFNYSIPGLSNLVQLNLAGNRFQRIQDTGVWSLCRLKWLDLSFNTIQGEMIGPPSNVSECAKYDLEMLRQIESNISGPIPATLGRLTALRELYLDSNDLIGPIPESLGNLTSLRILVLSGNYGLTGSIPTSLGKLRSLIKLDLSWNQLNGAIPLSLGQLSNLEILYLNGNSLTMSVPFSFGNLSKLEFLDLSSNLLNGTLPTSLGQLSKLQFLDISNNSLGGVVSEAHFANMSMLKHLAATSNHMLTFKFRRDWVPPFQISHVFLGSCNIAAEFPPWIRTQRNLVILMLSNASISGPLPDWLPDLPVISVLDLSHNRLSGPLTNLPSKNITEPVTNFAFIERLSDYSRVARVWLLKDNLFNGSIPESILCNITDFDILDLSRNRLSGNLPRCLANLQALRVMILSSNRLSGIIPSAFGQLGWLQWLHLNNNSFHGELPLALANCTRLEVLDLGENEFSGRIPKWIGEELISLIVLRLHKNNFTGSIPIELCQRSELQIMDLGNNNLTGIIPRCFQDLSGMTKGAGSYLDFSGGYEQTVIQVMKGVSLEYTTTMSYVVNMDLSSNKLVGEIPKELTVLSRLLGLNLSHNHLTGQIPDRIGDMSSLQSLDLSENNLSGTIPQSLSALTFLSHLNLSYNNLSGQIPTGSQLQTLIEPWMYAGNSELCGSPLPKKCSRDEVPTIAKENDKEEENGDDDDDSSSEKGWLVLVVASGFITGLSGFFAVLVFKQNWRHKFFHFVEEVYAEKIGNSVAVKSSQERNLRR